MAGKAVVSTPKGQPTGGSQQDYRPFEKRDFYDYQWCVKDPMVAIYALAGEYDFDAHAAIIFLQRLKLVTLSAAKPVAGAGGAQAHTRY